MTICSKIKTLITNPRYWELLEEKKLGRFIGEDNIGSTKVFDYYYFSHKKDNINYYWGIKYENKHS